MIFQKSISRTDRYEKSPETAWQIVDGKAVVLDRREGELIHFNDLGARIWEELDPSKSFGDLVRILGREFEAPQETLEKDVRKFIARLEKMELIRKCGGT